MEGVERRAGDEGRLVRDPEVSDSLVRVDKDDSLVHDSQHSSESHW